MKVSTVRVGFQVLLHAVLIGHVLAYYFLDWRALGGLDFQAFFHDLLGRGLLSAGALLAALALAFTIVLGRVFCSWGCHFGAFQDLAAWALRRLGVRLPFLRTRFLHWLPYTLLVAVFIAPAVEAWLERGLDGTKLRVDLSANAPWATFPGWLGSAVTFLGCGAAVLLFLGTRGFCRFVCPYGAAFRVLDRAAPLRVRRVAACAVDCAPNGGSPDEAAPCTLACPMAIDVHAEVRARGAVANVDCVRCHLCIEACPSGALAYGLRSLPVLSPAIPSGAAASKPAPAITAREEVVVAAVSLAAFLAWDLVFAAHFLAAVMALGEGFLALLALRVLTQKDLRLGRIPLRAAGRWTPAGAAALGLFVLSLAPLAQGGVFKVLVGFGDRAFAEVFPGGGPSAAGGSDETAAGGSSPALDPERRRAALARCQRAYRQALKIVPGHREARTRLVVALAESGDPEALALAEALARESPDLEALAVWVRLRMAPRARDPGR
jgi:ferredoxin